MRAIILGALLVSASATATLAGQPSAVLPLPTLRPSLPISVASEMPTAAAEPAPACDWQRVMRIDGGRATAIAHGFAFDAYGQSSSAGWKTPRLVLAYQQDGVATVDFVACRPEAGAQVVSPIETHMGLGLDPETTRVIIRSRTNTVEVEIDD
jgi:hypothetical protein